MAVNGMDIAEFAKQWTGTPYVWGGNSLSKGVDCSGLVQQVYKNFGITVPRVTYSQIGEGKAVGMNELQVGDMVFFDTDRTKNGPDHVGIYLGDGKMIHAPRPGQPVQVTSLTTGYYQSRFMGGRRVSALEGGGNAEDWKPNDTKKLSPEELAASYGWAYSFLKSNKEIRGVFDDAVSGSWSPDKFQAKLRNTKWWKENSKTMRAAAVEKNTDPATYNARVDASKIQIQQLAAEMGAAVPSSRLRKIAEQAIKTNLSEDGLRNILGGYIKFQENGSTLNGQAGQYEHMIREFAHNYGVSLDRGTVKRQAQFIGRKVATEQDFKNQIVNQAISTFPGFKEQLEGGQTMMDIASPYIQQMADDLEIPWTQIDLKNPLIKQALNGVDGKGKPTGMDLMTFRNLIRNDPRWDTSQGAQDRVMEVGTKVLRDMGLISGEEVGE